MTFNTPGYSLHGGFISTSSSGLTVTTNVDATLGAGLEYEFSNSNVLTKTGSATLTLSTAGLRTVQVNQGELYVVGSSPLFSSNVILANAPGVTVTLDPSTPIAQMQGLSGGGSSGGLVQPVNKPETVTLSAGGGTFGGTLADNGAGILAIDYKGPSTESLTGMNTYSGPTTIESGALILSGNGSATSTSVSISPGAVLELDDRGTLIGSRLSATNPISINAGTLALYANTTTSVNENVGPLVFAGATKIAANMTPISMAQLSFAGLTRVGHGVLSLVGPPVAVTGLTNGSTGIVAPYVTVSGDWGTVDAAGHITAFSAYVPDINAASATDNVRIVSSGTITLAAPTTVGSLNLQAAATLNPVLDLGGHNLALTTGGILSSAGTGTSIIRNGSLSTTSGEIVVTTTDNNLTINADIVETAGGTALTKTGNRVLTLTGNNTYTGPTAIMQGTLVVSSDANLGLGTTIDFQGGTLQAAGSFTSAKGFDPTSNGGTINTNGFNVEFTGPVFGALTKNGLGTLTLDNAMASKITVTQGLLVLPNGAASSSVVLNGANLQAAGTLESFVWNAGGATPSILDIGGSTAATLTTGTASFSSVGTMQIDFGLGSTHSDFWLITQDLGIWPTAAGSMKFEFQNLGGLTTGVDYPLMSFPSSDFPFGPPSPSIFALTPDLVAAGWVATFSTTSTGASVEFSRVPEPSGICLIALGIATLTLGRCRIAAHMRAN